MKNIYTFDASFDADLASKGVNLRTCKIESYLRWAEEQDQEEQQASNVRDVFINR